MRIFLSKLYQPLVGWMAQFDSPKAEGLKSTLRLFVMMAVSWLIVQVLGQIDLVPEYQYLKVWVFKFYIPLRSVLFFVLTAVQKYIDKLFFEQNSESKLKSKGKTTTGLIPL